MKTSRREQDSTKLLFLFTVLGAVFSFAYTVAANDEAKEQSPMARNRSKAAANAPDDGASGYYRYQIGRAHV